MINRRIFPHSLIVVLCVLSLISMSLISSFGIELSDSSDQKNSIKIYLDCNKTDGFLKHFGEINCGPLPNPEVNGVDLTIQFKHTGINFVRTHDFNGPADISTIFPDFSKDPTDPSNYNFSFTDPFITSIIQADCDVFYRLGESANTDEQLRNPPENFSKWAEICKHIVMHYNDGWANGYHYNISYWEIWNEPDLDGFWNGTAEQYYELYHVTAKTLKEYDTTLNIGGPCTSSIFDQNFTVEFLSYVQTHQIPLDFFSWHMYADTPNQLYEGSKQIRDLLDSFGLFEVENINTEWNYNILSPQRDKDNAKNAAFTACSLTVFQFADTDHAFRYRATQDNNPLTRFIGFDLSLFSHEGVYKKPALSYLAMNYMIDQTPIIIKIDDQNAVDKTTFLSSISEDKSNISLLLSNFGDSEIDYTIVFAENLPWNSSYTLATYVIDEEYDLEIIEQIETKKTEINGKLLSNSVNFVRLTNSSILPDQGPETLDIPFLLRFPIFDPLAKILAILLMLLFFG